MNIKQQELLFVYYMVLMTVEEPTTQKLQKCIKGTERKRILRKVRPQLYLQSKRRYERVRSSKIIEEIQRNIQGNKQEKFYKILQNCKVYFLEKISHQERALPNFITERRHSLSFF